MINNNQNKNPNQNNNNHQNTQSNNNQNNNKNNNQTTNKNNNQTTNKNNNQTTNQNNNQPTNKNNRQPVIRTKKLTRGQVCADWLSKWAGSWSFIGLFIVFLIIWMALNTYLIIFGQWDNYPFILLNLILSCIAAIQAPVILMSQNRQSEQDRQRAQYDYLVDRKAEREIKQIQIDILEIKEALLKQSTKSQTYRLREEIKRLEEEIQKIKN